MVEERIHYSLHHLMNWLSIGDRMNIFVLHNVKLVSQSHNVHLQRMFFHVNLYASEMADKLAKKGCEGISTSGTSHIS